MAQAMTNDDFDLELLIKILKMTTHENDNQALVATRKANALLARAGQDWDKLIRGKITIVNDPFGNIPTPPPAQAAPPPRPTPPQPPPPQRSRRDIHWVATWISLLEANRALLSSYDRQRLDQVTIDWQHHTPDMLDSDYRWLQSEAAAFEPRTRDPAQVCTFFDTCDLAPITLSDTQMVTQIRQRWTARRDNKMSNYDYNYIEAIHNRHARSTTRGRGRGRRS